jgi:hypothetical protein
LGKEGPLQPDAPPPLHQSNRRFDIQPKITIQTVLEKIPVAVGGANVFMAEFFYAPLKT